MKKIYFFCIVAFITLAAFNVNIAIDNEKNVELNLSGVMALTNNENPVQSIKYTYDASGNIIKRELIVTYRGGKENEQESEAGGGLTKSAFSGTGNTDDAFEETKEVEDVVSEIKINVYPNPCQGIVQVDISGVEIPHVAVIEIFSSNGAMAGKWTEISTTNIMDITNNPAGTYFLRLSLEKDYVKTWKILIINN